MAARIIQGVFMDDVEGCRTSPAQRSDGDARHSLGQAIVDQMWALINLTPKSMLGGSLEGAPISPWLRSACRHNRRLERSTQ